MRGGLLAAVGMAAMVWSGAGFAQTPPAPTTPAPASPATAPVAGPSTTLRDALVRTYDSNPTLMAQRQQLRILDEDSALARSAGRPQASADVNFTQDVVTHNLGPNGRQLDGGTTIRVPLYAGGTVRNSVRAADIRVDAGRADLRATEGDIFTEAVAAYMDVIRDRSIVQLNQNQVRVLETNLQATRDRFEVGDLTRTDVAQSEARLSIARSSLAQAEGQLVASLQNYERVIGVAPADLQPPPALPTLPSAPEQATDFALANNADLASIAAQARAAGFDVSVARGQRLPTISGVSSFRYIDSLGTNDSELGIEVGPESTASLGVGLSLTVPLYQGGAASARVRQASANRGRLLEQSIAVERSVVANVRAAYAAWQAANDAIESNTIAVAANELALEGTRAEQTVGTRNVLDVLNAEQELLNSQVLLVTARRDAYVAGFQLLNAMGQAEAEDLNLDGGPLYDPTVDYERYVHDWSDWNDGPTVRAVSTRTVPADANSPVTVLPQ